MGWPARMAGESDLGPDSLTVTATFMVHLTAIDLTTPYDFGSTSLKLYSGCSWGNSYGDHLRQSSMFKYELVHPADCPPTKGVVDYKLI